MANNQNISTIDAKDIKFPKETSDYQNIYIPTLKATPTHLIKSENLESIYNKIYQNKKCIIKM